MEYGTFKDAAGSQFISHAYVHVLKVICGDKTTKEHEEEQVVKLIVTVS